MVMEFVRIWRSTDNCVGTYRSDAAYDGHDDGSNSRDDGFNSASNGGDD